MVSTILAVLTEPPTARALLDAAAVAAVDPACRIEALHIRVDPESLILPTEEVMTRKRRAELEASLAERAQRLRLAYDEWAQAAAGLADRAAWHEVAGAVEAVVTARGKLADLLVLARPAGSEGEEALHAALFAVGRLFLLVPPDGGAGQARRLEFGRHMAIAWKASETAERAVVGALPWLRRAQRISVLVAGRDGETPPDALLALLAGHGIAASAIAVAPIAMAAGDEGVGAALLAEARAVGADSLVMGAYRRHRFFEWVLGGVTRHVLHHADLPAFMLH
jgi:nucleotide-binding universal stress UspA family protein